MTFSNEEFKNTLQHDPMRASLMLLGHLEEKSIEEKIVTKVHEPTKHEAGFYISFETPQGVIGLWSCWLKDQLYIGYPHDWNVDNELIKKTLNVEDACSVTHYEYVGYNKPNRRSVRKWADFYGDRLDEGGRVWVMHQDKHSHGHQFPLIQNGKLKELYYGHDESNTIATYPYSHCNENEPDGPSTNKKAIMTFRDKFIQLAINIANEHGGIIAVHTKYDFTIFTPELLEAMGYSDIRYLKGTPGVVESFGGTILHATKENEELVLKSANSIVPWVNIRKVPTNKDVTLEDILNNHLVF